MTLIDRWTLLAGLLVGAVGIAILWAAGVDFPVAVPPGLVILLAGAVLVAAVDRTWAHGIGGALGLFVLVGFLVSGIVGTAEYDGFANLVGDNGAAIALGQGVQLVGVVLAAVAGLGLVVRRPARP